MNRRWRNLLPRRGIIRTRPWFPPPTSQALPLTAIEQVGPRPRWATVRRGQVQNVPPAPPAIIQDLIPAFLDPAGLRPRGSAFSRRGRVFAVPPVAPPVAGLLGASRPRARGVPRRRSVFHAVPPPQPSLIPSPVRRPRLGVPSRRGETFFTPVVPPAGSAPPSPQGARAQRRYPGFPFRRGLVRPRPWFEPAEQQLPPPATISAPRRAAVVAARRGRFTAGPGQLPVTPAAPARRPRLTALLPRRGAFQPVPPVSGTLAGPGPLVLSGVRPTRRYSGWLARRGLIRPRPWFETATAQAAVPAFIDQSGGRPRWSPRPRRGAFSSALLVGLAPPPPTWPPGFTCRPRPGAVLSHQGVFQPVPTATPIPPGVASRHLRVAPPMRRGAFITGPALGHATPALGLIDSSGSRLRWFPLPRRGEFITTPTPLIPVAPPVFVVRRSRLGVRVINRPWVTTPPAAPVVSAGVTPPRVARTLRRTQLTWRRGRFTPTPLPRPAGPGPVAPAMLRGSRRHGFLTRRGEFWVTRLTGAAPASRGRMGWADRSTPGMSHVTRTTATMSGV